MPQSDRKHDRPAAIQSMGRSISLAASDLTRRLVRRARSPALRPTSGGVSILEVLDRFDCEIVEIHVTGCSAVLRPLLYQLSYLGGRRSAGRRR